ncbi:hypothetical protein D3C74_500840 [compost metagenome]
MTAWVTRILDNHRKYVVGHRYNMRLIDDLNRMNNRYHLWVKLMIYKLDRRAHDRVVMTMTHNVQLLSVN